MLNPHDKSRIRESSLVARDDWRGCAELDGMTKHTLPIWFFPKKGPFSLSNVISEYELPSPGAYRRLIFAVISSVIIEITLPHVLVTDFISDAAREL